MYSQWLEVYGMLAKTEEYQKKIRKRNERYGVYRSGEGTPEELRMKAKERDEQMRIEKMFENNEYSNDTKINDKLYKMSMKNFKTKVLANDDNDLLPHHELTVGNPHLSLFASFPRNL